MGEPSWRIGEGSGDKETLRAGLGGRREGIYRREGRFICSLQPLHNLTVPEEIHEIEGSAPVSTVWKRHGRY